MKAVTKWLAIGLLIAELVLVGLGDWFARFLPPTLQEAKATPAWPMPSLFLPLSVIGGLLLVCFFAGLLGIIRYKWWGRLLFTIFWIGDLLLLPLLPPLIRPALEVSLSELTLLAAGAILALTWLSPVSQLYVRVPPSPGA